MLHPEYTVIIATHRRAPLLRRALESVLAQQWPFHQIIVVSDVADPETYTVAHELLRDGDVFIQRSGIPGPAASRNTALKLVTGSDVVFLDDDDAFREDFLSSVARLRGESQTPEILFTNFEVIHEHEDGRVIPMDLAAFTPEHVWIKNFIPNNCVIYPYSQLADVWYDETIAYEDWDFLLSAHTNAPLRHVPTYGPVIYKNANAEEANRGEKNNAQLLECYVRTYRKHSATPTIREQRKGFFYSVGIDLDAYMELDFS